MRSRSGESWVTHVLLTCTHCDLCVNQTGESMFGW